MCGNGIRSLMMFARQLGVVTDHCICGTKERRLELWHKGGRVTVDMGEVISYSWSAQAEVAGKTYEGAWLNTGVPHVRFGAAAASTHPGSWRCLCLAWPTLPSPSSVARCATTQTSSRATVSM